MIEEIFNIKNGSFRGKDGKEKKIAYIDPTTSESTFAYREEIKKYGAKWDNYKKTWYWFLNDNPQEVYNTQIKPCLEFLMSVEKNDTGEERDVIKIIDKLIAELGNVPENLGDTEIVATSAKEVKMNLEAFKRELINAVSAEEFKKMMEPIIKFKRAQGRSYSLLNAILIYCQRPNAKMVKSKSNWEDVNRGIKPGAKPIWIWNPIFKDSKPKSKEEKNRIIKSFLDKENVTDRKDLSIRGKEELKVALNSGGVVDHFELMPRAYDYADTYQLEGQPDIVGDPDAEVEWYNDSGEETTETKTYCNALMLVIKEKGIKLSGVENLGGARGVSMSGRIEVLKNTPKNAGFFNTLVHEYAHEILHQKYLSSNNEDMKAYFVGTSEGREKVEQQAELCAWIVLRSFGIDMPTNINYVGIWGLDEKNAISVFDSVSTTAKLIATQIDEKIQRINENVGRHIIPSGYEIAKMLGCGDVYKQSLMMNKGSFQMTNEDIENLVNESVKRILKNLL